MTHRHEARVLAFKALFSWELNKTTTFADIIAMDTISSSTFGEEIFNGVINNIERIDEILRSSLINWKFERVEKVELSILRLSIFSMLFQKDIAKVIIIDEAINISKEFGSEKSYRHINGILDALVI